MVFGAPSNNYVHTFSSESLKSWELAKMLLATRIHEWHDKASGCVDPAYAHLLWRISRDVAYQALSCFSACNTEKLGGAWDEASTRRDSKTTAITEISF